MRIAATLASTVLLITAPGGCLMAPHVPPTSNPVKSDRFRGDGFALGLGMTTNFRATLTEDGREREVVYGPRRTIAAVQMVAMTARYTLNERCDGGVQLGVGRTGAEARCGLGSPQSAVSVATGAEWLWWQGIVGRTELQAGAMSDDVLGFITTGVTYSVFGHKIPLDGLQLHDGQNLLYGPPNPSVVVRQEELAWSSSAVVGFRHPSGHGAPFVLLGFTLDKPIATTEPSFECLGCEEPHYFEDFDPGIRVGAMVGLAAPFD